MEWTREVLGFLIYRDQGQGSLMGQAVATFLFERPMPAVGCAEDELSLGWLENTVRVTGSLAISNATEMFN